MNRIDQTFERLKQTDAKALVGFVTAGDPSPDMSHRLIAAMCTAGLDILELGVPFSDPTADGPVIQRASERALKQGVTLASVMELTATVRQDSDVPIILFTYYNPILAYGPRAFYEDALANGADGVLVVDLPHEEADELTALWPDQRLPLIRLIAPTTPADRMADISRAAEGFIYLVSKTGVTGSDGLDTGLVARHTSRLREFTSTPVCAGFGISTAEDVAGIAAAADGVVIGSAFERIIENHLDDPDLPQLMADRVQIYKQAAVAA